MASTVVIDANVALAAVLPLPYSADADLHFQAWGNAKVTLSVPVLWTYEVTTGLRRAAYETMIDEEQLEEALAFLEAMDIETIHPSPGLNRIALDWAERLDQNKAYDGHYLAVAEQLKAEFWTADRRLVNALTDRGTGWARWIGEP